MYACMRICSHTLPAATHARPTNCSPSDARACARARAQDKAHLEQLLSQTQADRSEEDVAASEKLKADREALLSRAVQAEELQVALEQERARLHDDLEARCLGFRV
jgi:hypothetical protein